jgi:hypothetical protein
MPISLHKQATMTLKVRRPAIRTAQLFSGENRFSWRMTYEAAYHRRPRMWLDFQLTDARPTLGSGFITRT